MPKRRSPRPSPSSNCLILSLRCRARPYLDLAHWLSESCLAPIGACVWLLLPPGFTGKSDRLFTLSCAMTWTPISHSS